MVANSITLLKKKNSNWKTIQSKVFRVCGTHLCNVAMETFDIEVYASQSEGVFYPLHFKNYTRFNSVDYMMQRKPSP